MIEAWELVICNCLISALDLMLMLEEMLMSLEKVAVGHGTRCHAVSIDEVVYFVYIPLFVNDDDAVALISFSNNDIVLFELIFYTRSYLF